MAGPDFGLCGLIGIRMTLAQDGFILWAWTGLVAGGTKLVGCVARWQIAPSQFWDFTTVGVCWCAAERSGVLLSSLVRCWCAAVQPDAVLVCRCAAVRTMLCRLWLVAGSWAVDQGGQDQLSETQSGLDNTLPISRKQRAFMLDIWLEQLGSWRRFPSS